MAVERNCRRHNILIPDYRGIIDHRSWSSTNSPMLGTGLSPRIRLSRAARIALTASRIRISLGEFAPERLDQRSGGIMAGLYFEEFEEGQVLEHAINRTVNEL